MSKNIINIAISILLISIIGYGIYWYLYLRNDGGNTPNINTQTDEGGFSPFGRSEAKNTEQKNETGESAGVDKDKTGDTAVTAIPKIRKLADFPVSGLSASSTKSSSVARFIDRGTGHVYEADSNSSDIIKISNTTLPKTYRTYWNKNLTSFITRYTKDSSDIINNFYAELRSTGTSTSVTPFEVKGLYMSSSIDQVAISPTRDRVFTWNSESNGGIGYVSAFNEKNKIKVYDSPLRQVLIDWPETNTLTINTKPSSMASGYLYTVNIKDGTTSKKLTGIKGLSSKGSRDMANIIYSNTQGGRFGTFILNTKDNTVQEISFKTLADKCVWSDLRKNEIYCAVPTEVPTGTYPDDWYRGNVSFTDQIWHLNTKTGEIHLLANITGLSGELVDAIELNLDQKENYLYFINKRDLTPWSLDLNQ